MPAEISDNSKDHKPAPTPLHDEATRHLARPVRNLTPLNLEADGTYTVTAGNSISRIALQSLALRGESADGMKAEIDRIIALNVEKYPSLKTHPELIKTGWHLQIQGGEHADKQPPSIPMERAQWYDAPTAKTTIVHKGEHCVAPAGAWLIVEPGGEAILNAGSKAFAAPGSMIKMALPGSLVVAGGGEIHDYGARIQMGDGHGVVQSKIVAEDVRTLPVQVAQNKPNDVGPMPTRRPSEQTPFVSRSFAPGWTSNTQLAMGNYPELELFGKTGE